MEKKNQLLRPSQVYLLKQLYKFRFVTTIDLAQYRNLSSHSAIFRSLETLTRLGCVIKRYEPSYKIDRRSAVYSISKRGIQYLRSLHIFNEQVLHAMYKNLTVSDDFIEQHLQVLRIATAINKQYPDRFDIFTRAEIIDQDYFPEPRPELYLRRRESNSNPQEYMLYIVDNPMKFIFKKKLDTWITHYEEEGWDGTYPTVLLVCSTQSIEMRARTHLMNLGLDDELSIMTTTLKGLLSAVKGKVWMHHENDQALLSL